MVVEVTTKYSILDSKGTEMIKRHLLLLIAIAVASASLSGCKSAPVAEKAKSKQLAFPPEPDEPRYYFERAILKSTDVTEEAGDSVLTRALTGAKKSAAGFAKPYAIAVHHGRIYVGDSARRTVMVFDIPGKKFFQIGLEENENGQGKLSKPLGIDIDKAGNVYVLDATLKLINVYTGDGEFIRSFGSPAQLYKPAGLGVSSDGTRVYAVDIGGSSSNEHKIVVFNGITGEYLSTIGERGGGPGQFNLPRDVTVAPDGTIYVVDGGNFRVQKFNKDQQFVSMFGSIGRQAGQFSRPKEAAVDPSGNLYVVDTIFGNFQIFNPEGQLLMSIGQRSNTNGPALYSLPSGIAIDDDGRVYVVDQFFKRVDIFRPASLPEDGGWIGKFNPKLATLELIQPTASPADSASNVEPSDAAPASPPPASN